MTKVTLLLMIHLWDIIKQQGLISTKNRNTKKRIQRLVRVLLAVLRRAFNINFDIILYGPSTSSSSNTLATLILEWADYHIISSWSLKLLTLPPAPGGKKKKNKTLKNSDMTAVFKQIYPHEERQSQYSLSQKTSSPQSAPPQTSWLS